MSTWGGKRNGAGRKPKNVAFEGAPDQYGRTFIYFPCNDGQLEMRPYDRQKLLTKSRWLVNNFGLAARAVDGVARYTVGRGICPQARTSKRDWNQEVEEAFESKCGTSSFGFDVAAQVNFYEAQSLIVRQFLTDGDFFAQLMRSEAGSGMMMFIPGDVCQSRYDDKIFQDGVRIDPLGRPREYKFISDYEKQTFSTIPAEDVIQFKRLHRVGYLRGVPALRHAVNHMHDMTDILSFTKGSFKLASQVAFILESPEAGRIAMGSNVIKIQKALSSGGTAEVTHDKVYPLAGHVQMKPGERLTPLQNPHPGQSFDPFMSFLIRDIAWGVGISPELLWNITTTGGANARLVLASDQMLFEELQQLLINQFCRRFWIFWLWHEIKAGRISYPGDDWWKHTWILPARLTVDFTKDGKLLADLCDRGLLSPDRYYGMQGLDAETEELDVIRRRARRKKQVEEVAAEEGVELTVEECFPPPPGATNVNHPPEIVSENEVADISQNQDDE